MPTTSPQEPSQCCRLSITAVPTALEHVRRTVRSRLHEWGQPELVDLAELGVTELLTNVCTHVEDKRCTVSMTCGADAVRIEVHDSDPHIPSPRVAHEWEESGRGLLLLATMADAWGGTPLGSGKAMWFELSVKP